MYNLLVKYLRSRIDITDEELVGMLFFFNSKQFEKGDMIVKATDSGKNMYFINKGLIRVYHEVENKETTMDILCEGEWYSDLLAFNSGAPTTYNVVALESTEMFYISNEPAYTLLDDNPKFIRLCRMMANDYFIQYLTFNNAKRIHNMEEKYLLYQRLRPEVFKRAPLKHIASLLDMNPATLSRIRKKVTDSNTLLTVQ